MDGTTAARSAARVPDRNALQRQAKRMHAEARKHKRLAAHHQRQARFAMRQFDAFKATLESLGIEVIIEPEPITHARQGGNSERSNGRTS